MRGKKTKALRTEERNRPGRRHGGPASGKFTYPKRWRYEQKGDFKVLVASIDDIREEVEKNGQAVD